MVDEARYRYLSLQFKDDVLVGATSIGLTQHVGALRGPIHGQVKLGDWKDRLLASPARLRRCLRRAQPAADGAGALRTDGMETRVTIRIAFKLFASLSDYLPGSHRGNRLELDVDRAPRWRR